MNTAYNTYFVGGPAKTNTIYKCILTTPANIDFFLSRGKMFLDFAGS